MNSYQKQNCKGCVYEQSHNDCYCLMFKDEPDGHCDKVKYPQPEFNRPQRVPNPPSKPIG